MKAFRAGVRLQLVVVRAQPDYWLTFATAPLMGILFLAMMKHAGRDDLVGAAVLAPVLFGLIQISIMVSGETIVDDREAGILESTIGAPSPLLLSVAGRISAITAMSAVGFGQSWLVAWVLFGAAVPIRHPIIFVMASLAMLFAMSATAMLMASVFVLVRRAPVVQISLPFPLLVLGGVLVPTSLLPPWVQPVARLTFMSWSSELLRDTLDASPVHDVLPRVAAIVGLGVATLGLASWVMSRVLDRVRRLGTISFT